MKKLVFALVVVLAGRPVWAAPPCAGDCRESGSVTVADVLTGMKIALGQTGAERCRNADWDGDDTVTIDEVVLAMNNALDGCPEFPGDYFGTVDLGNGQTATMDLEVAETGDAEATVSIYQGEALATGDPSADGTEGSGAGLLHSLVLTGSVNLDTGEYSLTGSYVDSEQGTVPVSAQGTLPLPARGGGSFTFTQGQVPFDGSIRSGPGTPPTPVPTTTATPTATQTSPPASATRTPSPTATTGIPTPAVGCGGGYSLLQFSDVSGDVNANQPLTSLETTQGEGNITNMTSMGLYTFGGKLAKCPVEVMGVSRLVNFSFTLFGSPVVPGLTVQLGQAQTLFNYNEATAGPSLQSWKATSGTLTIDAIDGNRVTFHVTNARMVPGAPFIYGPPAIGSFTLNFSGFVTVAINNV